MAYTQSGNKAAQKYKREKRRRLNLEMSPEEMDMLQILADRAQKTRSAYLKTLILEAFKNTPMES